MSRKVILVVFAVVLMCAPLGLAAQEREMQVELEASLLERLEDLWGGFTAWLAGQVAPPPESFVDGSCAVDPDGCPDHQ